MTAVGSKTVMISGARAPIALEMARSFHAHGHRVIMVDSIRWTIARWSNTVSAYYVVPSPRFDPEGFVGQLQHIILKERVDHFIPTCEEAIFVAVYKDQLNCNVWTSDAEIMLQLHNKFRFTTMGLPVPETILVSSFREWSNSSRFVFKPIFSRFASSVIIGKKCSISDFKYPDDWIAQRRIYGREVCVYSIWDHGKMKAFQLYHPLYRAGKGAGVFFERVTNQAIRDHVETFGKELNYTGQLCFDVIIETKTNKLFFIECNPRGTSGAHLLNNQLASCFLEDLSIKDSNDQEHTIKYAMAILHPLDFFTKRVHQAKDVIYSKKDPLPFFLQFLSLLEITWIKLRRNIGWLEATTGDIEWNG